MKKIIPLFAFLLWLATTKLSARPVPTGSWDVIPRPQQVVTLEGEHGFEISQKTFIMTDGSEGLERSAQYLSDQISELTGIRLQPPTTGTMKRGKRLILLKTDPALGNPEAYQINCRERALVITGGGNAGVFYGIQTVRKAIAAGLRQEQVSQFALPAADIDDAPRYPYRGFLIDVSRHFFSVDYLKTLIDILALHHINYFHWHLTDDQGWRLEVKSRPRLTEVGQHRRETIVRYGSDEFDGRPVSGCYTREDVREVIRYAAERYMTVVPEIDMPGHSLAALASYPELGCTGGPYEVACQFGVFSDVLCAGNPATLAFAKDVLSEVMELFPSPYIHIGGDECPKSRWERCPKCQAKIAELGLTSRPGHTKENQLQTWWMNELEAFIRAHGRTMMGWDEILEGNPSERTVVMAWTTPQARLRSVREGYQTVVCPITNFYFSNPRWNQLQGRESIARVYEMEPSDPSLSAEENARILGAQGCIWTEWTADREKMEWQLLPRLAALAEVQWTQPGRKNLDDFMRRLPKLVRLYERYGWKASPPAVHPWT